MTEVHVATAGVDARPDVDPDTVAGALTGLTTPAELLAAVGARREAITRLDAELLTLAVEWAHAHPWLPEDGGRPVRWRAQRCVTDHDGTFDDGGPAEDCDLDEFLDFGLPPVAWDAPAAFAAANEMPTPSGRAYLRDALTLRHRLPLTWAQVQAGLCPAWKAARVAQAVLGRPADVAAYVDEVASAKAGGIGPIVLHRVVEAAMVELYPEEHELQQAEAEEAQYVQLHRPHGVTGLAELVVRGAWNDLADFERAVGHLAAALAVLADDPDALTGPYAELAGVPVGVRRARAVAILAHPEDALALLAEARSILDQRADAAPEERRPGRRPRFPARREFVLHLRLSDSALLGLDPGCTDHAGRALLSEAVRAWCGRPDAAITVKAVLDPSPDRYQQSMVGHEPPDWMRELVLVRDDFCVFPHCGVPARDCDLDHITAYADGGPTRAANLAPLCRHHHNLKTPTGRHLVWTYRVLAHGVYLWTDPHRRHYLRTRDGTMALHPPPS